MKSQSFLGFNPSLSYPGQKEKINFKFLFSHFFVVPQKVLWKAILMQLLKMHRARRVNNFFYVPVEKVFYNNKKNVD